VRKRDDKEAKTKVISLKKETYKPCAMVWIWLEYREAGNEWF
jgi:hypothetical protein